MKSKKSLVDTLSHLYSIHKLPSCIMIYGSETNKIDLIQEFYLFKVA